MNYSPKEPIDLPAWRKTQRRTLIQQRIALEPETLLRWQGAMDRHLEQAFRAMAQEWQTAIIGICWPHRNEFDARPFAMRRRVAGATITLPVVVAPDSALVFRTWHEDSLLADGPAGIPYPASGLDLKPSVLIIPAVGFDLEGYRLGYGGGYFDRTLAAMVPRPLVIATAYESAKMETLYPQAYDIPMDFVVTEKGIYIRSGGRLVLANGPIASR